MPAIHIQEKQNTSYTVHLRKIRRREHVDLTRQMARLQSSDPQVQGVEDVQGLRRCQLEWQMKRDARFGALAHSYLVTFNAKYIILYSSKIRQTDDK